MTKLDFISHEPSNIDDLLANPIDQFNHWMSEISEDQSIRNPDAACLSTLDPDGYPGGRMVLVRKIDDRGFMFYTNKNSIKGQALTALPKASLTYYWATHGKQVRIKGDIEQATDAESDAYFHSRPRGSQIAAMVSDQSKVIDGREALLDQYKALEKEYEGIDKLPRPDFWVGYRLVPTEVEFWVEQAYRLHDRFLYRRKSGSDTTWQISRLSP